ncbi:hypothetical protein [uncultured Dokdonia sp.]|uniref:hypothetical protein n=1 Tax=uncultured Dokdonia sp. TaxID=575653 RepID=UPI0026028B07|nr:hypothetical protein [uncultured Dokdonia sp.]
MDNKQFTLKKEATDSDSNCSTIKINDYYLSFNTNLNYTHAQDTDFSLYLLGNLFDYNDTKASNQDLLNILIEQTNKEDFFKVLDGYYGEYVIIYVRNNEFILLNDCCAQKEVYYTDTYSMVGSQIQLLSIEADFQKEHPYYSSNLFKKKKLHVGTSTSHPNIKHLAPNHYIDILHKKTIRFFPRKKIAPQSTHSVAQKAAKMLKGYITAIANRHEIVLPVTGGFDSRVLFLSSLHINCTYFVSQHQDMNNGHYDIKIAQKLTRIFDKHLHIIKDSNQNTETLNTNRIDNPRATSFPKLVNNKVLINGNISEIARNYFNYIHPVTAKKLTLLNGYSDNSYVIKNYKEWLLKNKETFKKYGYHTLDMFYWEEKMGNWTAKAKTEAHAMSIELMSPFNSRELLSLLLSTKRKDRDKFTSILYKKIIENLVDTHEEINSIPTNPDFERKRALFLKKLRLFKLFDAARLQLRILKRKI